MSAYDPRRSRPRPVVADDTEEAPIEALIGPDPEAVEASPGATSSPASPVATSPVAGANGATPLVPPTEPRRLVPSPRSSAPSPLWQLAPLLAGLSLLAVLVWWLTRRRQR